MRSESAANLSSNAIDCNGTMRSWLILKKPATARCLTGRLGCSKVPTLQRFRQTFDPVRQCQIKHRLSVKLAGRDHSKPSHLAIHSGLNVLG
jgi:hypothetical protein